MKQRIGKLKDLNNDAAHVAKVVAAEAELEKAKKTVIDGANRAVEELKKFSEESSREGANLPKLANSPSSSILPQFLGKEFCPIF